MREADCVLFAASFAVFGSFLGKTPCLPNQRHAAAIRPPQTGVVWPKTGQEALARIELSPVG
jgi:hypothetical protein